MAKGTKKKKKTQEEEGRAEMKVEKTNKRKREGQDDPAKEKKKKKALKKKKMKKTEEETSGKAKIKKDKKKKKKKKQKKDALSDETDATEKGSTSDIEVKATANEVKATAKSSETIESIKARLKEARRAWRKDKADKSLKQVYSAIRKELEAAEARLANGEPELTESMEPSKEEADEDEVKGATSSTRITPQLRPDVHGCSRCFVGNLSFQIDEEKLKEAFASCGKIEEVFFVTDKESGRFYGSSFVVFESPSVAQSAVNMSGTEVMGRPVKVNFAPPKVRAEQKPRLVKPPSQRPKDGTETAFFGNLSYDINDDALKEWCKDVGKIRQIRWLTHKDSGEFKGCGFVEFLTTDAVDKLVQEKNGEILLGRPVRIDYA